MRNELISSLLLMRDNKTTGTTTNSSASNQVDFPAKVRVSQIWSDSQRVSKKHSLFHVNKINTVSASSFKETVVLTNRRQGYLSIVVRKPPNLAWAPET